MKPYKAQVDAVKAALAHGRGIISMPTGTGKSYAMGMLVNALQMRTLIVVPNLTLKQQLTESFKAWFGNTKDITIENIDSKALEKAGDYDCLIIDEAHHVAASTYRNLNKRVWNKIYHRYYFTATPFRSRDEEQLLFESVAGDIIYEIGYHQAVEQGYIVPVEAYFVTIPKSTPKGTNWATVYSELVVSNEIRNQIITNLLVKVSVNNLPTLCLVKEIKHGERLHNDGAFSFVSGQNDQKHLITLFCEGKLNLLVGTNGVLGEGVDTKPAEYVIIAGLGKSKNQFMQQVGRGIRKHKDKTSCKVIIFKDLSHKWSVNHFKEQCKFLKDEYGVIPVEILI